MKKILLIASLMMIFCLAYAQIGEVKTEGCFAKIYNENGKFTGNKVFLSNSSSVAGYNSRYVVVKDGIFAKIYNSKGKFTGKKVFLGTFSYIKRVTETSILVKDGLYVKYYNFEGKFTGKKTFESK
jgi:hypothetical protein